MTALRSAFVLCGLCLIPLSLLHANAPAVSLSPTSLNFGNQPEGVTSPPQTVTLTNTGNATLLIKGIVVAGSAKADYGLTQNCGSQLAALANCTISVTFTPTNGGTRNASVSISDNASGSPQQVPLTGVGLVPYATFTPASLFLGSVVIGNTSAPQAVTVTNIGQAPLQIKSISIAGANPGEFSETNNCPSSLPISGTCSITATFTPAASWARVAAIMVTDNAQGSPQVIGLSGNGSKTGTPSASPASLTFTQQLVGTVSKAQTVTLSNTGTAALTLAGITASGDFSQTHTCGPSIAPGANCTVSVTFSPTAGGPRSGWLTFNLTDPFGLQTVTLSGGGAVPTPVTVLPRVSSLTFTQTEQYTAELSGVVTSNVTWSVDGIVGGNATSGTITSAGLYTPPAAAGTHTVTATNIANTKQHASVKAIVSGYTGTYTHHNDTFRTGQNNSEAALTTGNVNPTQFGKLFSYPVDGYLFAEPLWVPNVNIPGQGTHNVVYVATEHDSVFAFDADNPQSGPLCPGSSTVHCLWQSSFIDPAAGVTTVPRAAIENGYDLSPEAGITATPVIDPANDTLYVVARTMDTGGTTNCPVAPTSQFFQYLHALDITTGAEKPGSPVMICAQVPGTGYDSVGGVVSLNTWRQNNRAGLLLLNGVVYIAFASLEDLSPYHGWIIGYDENTLQQVNVFNATPNGQKSGIWQAGGGLLADTEGDIFAATGNGTFDVNTGGIDYGLGFLKLTPNGSNTLPVTDYFVPFNQAYLSLEMVNLDLASGGPILLPTQSGPVANLALACGKSGTIYLLNRDSLGGYNAGGDQIVEALYSTIGVSATPIGNWGTPAYFQGQIYIHGTKDPLKQFPISQSLLSGGPIATGQETFGYPGATPGISSNGTQNGIVWVIEADGATQSRPAVLRAYDAANVAHELYNSASNATRDQAGAAVKFTAPDIANGKVYVGTETELDVYGLLP